MIIMGGVMDREETIEAIKVMQAFVDGEDILVNEQSVKYNAIHSELGWNWIAFKYKVKPKPIERWITVYDTGLTGSCVFTSKEECELYFSANENQKAIKLVEEQ